MNANRTHGRQSGVVLILALIILATMMIGAAALTRTISNSNAIAGNLSFKQNSLNIADIGIETAMTDMISTILPSSQEDFWPANCSAVNGNCIYYPNQQATDAKGVPLTTNWSSIATINSLSIPSGYSVQYVVDRMCDPAAALPINNPIDECVSETFADGSSGGDLAVGSKKLTEAAQVAFRLTVRVTGPKSTESFVQAIVKM